MGSESRGRQSTPQIDCEHWSQFHSRRGTGPQTFAQRLARARLLFLRRRETAANWLALGVLLSAWQFEAQLDAEDALANPRLAIGIPAQARDVQPFWTAEPGTQSWISRASERASRTR